MDKKQLIISLHEIIDKLRQTDDISDYGFKVLKGFTIDIDNSLFQPGGLFMTNDIEAEFQLSPVFNKEVFFKKLEGSGKLGVDLNYYYEAVNDWSLKLPKRDKRKKKTPKGWIAEARSFMRRDKKDGKLVMIKSPEESEDKSKRMLEFFKMQ